MAAGDMDLGKLKIKVGLDGAGVSDGVNKIERDLKGGVRQFSSFSSAVRRGGQELAVNQAKLRMLSNSIQDQAKITQKYNNVLGDSSKMSKLTAGEQQKLRTAYDESKAKLNGYSNEFIATSKDMAVMQTKTTGVTGTMYKLGTGATEIGGKLTKHVSVPLGAVGAMALKTGFQFEESMSKVKATSGASASEMENLTAQARKLGKDTAFSAQEASEGMQELASAGFNAKEIMAAMPGVMDLAAVSGHNVGLAAQVTGATLRSFGLDASQAGHMADVLAKASADTGAETEDMGESMKYAAPIAHQLGLSVEETAAAVGIMADNGIKGSQAGTTLRGALTRLAKPTAAMTDVMNEYGLSFFDAKGEMLPFGDILKQLQTKLGGVDKKTRSAALTTLFGKEALSGMMALVGTTPGKFSKLTDGLKHSDGAAKDMAETMQDNAKNSIEQMMGSLSDAAISISTAVAPTVRDLADFVGKLADAFTDLSPTAQRILVQMGLLAVAAGPTLMIFGKLTTGTVEMIAAFRGMRAGASAAQTIAALGGTAGATSGKMATLGMGAGKAAGLLGALNPVTLGVVGGLALLGGGLALTGKLFADHVYATRWGDGVSAGAAKGLDGVQHAQQGISDALAKTGNDGRTASKDVGDAFDKLAGAVEKAAKRTNSALEKSLKDYPPEVRAVMEKAIRAEQDANNKRVDEAKKLADTVGKIENQKGKLTLEQQTYVNNAREKMNELAVRSLGLSGKKQKEVLAALNTDVDNMSRSSRTKAVESIRGTLEKTEQSYNKQREGIKKAYDAGIIDSKAYHTALKELDSQHAKSTDGMIGRMYELMKANGMSTSEMQMQFGLMGVSLNDAQKAYEKMSNGANKSTGMVIDSTSKMSEKTRSAVQQWNSLVFDEKTGKVKTNAKEEVEKAMASGKNWNNLVLAAKQAKVGSNARKVFLEAALETGKWNKLSISEKKAIINSNVGQKIATDKNTINSFNKMSIPAKKIITTSNTPEEIEKGLKKIGEWKNAPAPIKKLITESNAPMVTDASKMKIDGWNNLKPATKKLLTEDYSSENFKAAIKNQSDWNALPSDVKNLLANNENAKHALNEAKIKVKDYNATPASMKILRGKDENVQKVTLGGKKHVQDFNRTNPNMKVLKGSSKNVDNAANKGKGSIKSFNGTKPGTKQLKGNSSNVDNASKSGKSGINQFNRTNPNMKHLRGDSSSARSASSSGRNAIASYNGKSVPTKRINASWQGGGAVSWAKQALNSVPNVHRFIDIFTRHHRAGGDPNFMGGDVTVNDQKGSLYKELIVKPNGQEMLFSGRNRNINLPAGSTIYNATDTQQILDARRNMDDVQSLSQIGKSSPVSGNNSELAGLLRQLNQTSNNALGQIIQLLELSNSEGTTGNGIVSQNTLNELVDALNNRSGQRISQRSNNTF
ncbi:phage tail tape measure protein [Weissella viridescens]